MAKKGSVWVKRVIVGIGGALAFLVLAAIVIPLVIDVDQYRPQIVKAANEQLNGKLTIGKLSLSLWGQVEIDIDGIRLEDTHGEQLVAVDETYAQISFLSILSGKPKLIFRMHKPDVNVVKDQQGRLNVLSVLKEKPDEVEPEDDVVADEERSDLPLMGLIAASGLNVELVDAQIQFQDHTTGFVQDFKDLNVQLIDISMIRPMNMRIWGDLGTEVADVISIKGPFKIDGIISPEFDGLAFKQVAVDLMLNFDGIAVDMGETFRKPAGLPTNIKIKMAAAPEFVDISDLVVKFHNAELNARAKIIDLQQPSPQIDFALKSKPVDLSEWGKLVVALQELELEGRMDVAAAANGSLANLTYSADLDIQDLLATTPALQARPKMQVGLNVVTNELKLARFDFEAPGTDLAVRANVKNFSAPQITIDVKSKGIDLDQLLPAPVPESGVPAKGGDQAATGGSRSAETATGADETPGTDVDKALGPVRTNEFIKSVNAHVDMQIASFKGMNVDASDIAAVFSFNDLVAAIDRFNVNVWGGLIKANANIDLKPESPLYRMNLNVNQIDLQTAVESQMESLRNTVIGKLSFKASGGGRSLNSDQILKNLDMNGSFKMEDAKFASVDVGVMVVEAVNTALADIKKKVPPLADKKIKTPENFSSRYKEISSSFGLKGGVFSAPNFRTVSVEKEGIDLHGKTVADLVGDKLDADWLVIDTYNVTKARDVTVNMNGVNIEHILAEGDKPVSFPVKVGCQLSAPCYQYDQVARHLAAIALNNVRGAAKERVGKEVGKVKEKAKKEVSKQKEKTKKEAEEKIGKEADKLKKRFGF